MIEQPAPNADYLDRPDVRATLRSRPVATYLGARRGPVGYAVLVVVSLAAAVEAWRVVSPWLGAALALVTAQAVLDWLVSWYRVASLAYRRTMEEAEARAADRDDPEDSA